MHEYNEISYEYNNDNDIYHINANDIYHTCYHITLMGSYGY